MKIVTILAATFLLPLEGWGISIWRLFVFIKHNAKHIRPLDCFSPLYDESKTWYYVQNQIIANKLALCCDI